MNETIESAFRLLEILYKDRLDYDEYSTIHDAITELQRKNAELQSKLSIIAAAVEKIQTEVK